MQTIRAVIFDLGRVLVDVRFNRESLTFFGVKDDDGDMEKILTAAFSNPLFRDYNMGRISTEAFYQAYCQQHRLQLDFETFKEKWCSVFAPIEGMENLFVRIKTHYSVGLLSDTDPLHWQYCRQHFPFLQSIKHPTLSYEIGALKPAPVCYLKAAENTGFAPDQCLFIDDRPINVQGAQRVGMAGIVFENALQLENALRRYGLNF